MSLNQKAAQMSARIVAHCEASALSLGGIAARLAAGEVLTSTLCREIFIYCRARCLNLGSAMLLTELMSLANDLAADELAHMEDCAKLQTSGDFEPDFTVPALPVDAVLYANHPMQPHTKVERRVIHNWLKFMAYHSWEVECVDDGDNWVDLAELKGDHPDLSPALAVMQLVFNLDECRIQFGRKFNGEDVAHVVHVVLGNGVDCLVNWGYSNGDADGFNAVMEGFEACDFE